MFVINSISQFRLAKQVRLWFVVKGKYVNFNLKKENARVYIQITYLSFEPVCPSVTQSDCKFVCLSSLLTSCQILHMNSYSCFISAGHMVNSNNRSLTVFQVFVASNISHHLLLRWKWSNPSEIITFCVFSGDFYFHIFW